MKIKKILILIFILIIILTTIGITIYMLNNKIESTNGETIEYNKENMTDEVIEDIPEVSLENTNIEISETEETANNITITISSKLEGYNLYYHINKIEKLENKNEENQDENEISILDNQEDYILYKDSIQIEQNSNIYFRYELEGKYSERPYILEINNINKEKVITEEPKDEKATEEELKKENINSADSEAKYYVIVNYGSNVVTVYGKDSNNKYTVPVKAMVCSTGKDTPRSGVYKLTNTRYRWRALFGGVYGQYAVKIVGNILFHSVPYLSTDNSTLEYWEYDKLGTTASAGCVRLTVTDALWIYNNCGSGTQVEFSSNAENPLGKPTAPKISSYESLRGFDPTDPASNNPWKNVKVNTNVDNKSQSKNSSDNSNNNSNIINSNSNNVKDKEKTDKKENASNNTNKTNNTTNNKNNTNITTNNINKVNNDNKNSNSVKINTNTVNNKNNNNVINKNENKH